MYKLIAVAPVLLLTALEFGCSGQAPTTLSGSGMDSVAGNASSAGAPASGGMSGAAGATASGGTTPNGGATATGGAGDGATSGAGTGNAGASNGGTAGDGSAGTANGGSAGSATGGNAGTAGTAGIAGSSGAAGSGVVFPPGCTCMNLGPPACAPTGHITYTLAKSSNPTATEQSAYEAITCAMDGAVAYYNCNTTITKQLNVTYVPSVPTADGNINGAVRFGGTSYMECVTGMHEIAHTVGVGTASNWGTYSVGGVFTGTNAITQLRAITGVDTDVLHSDTQHFWPYGLNYTSEAHSTADLIDHCMMVTAIRKDLGLE
ncbi:MAG TPA: hypothetical protein VGM29_10770 [Polyangiaceae bacterium]